MSKKNTEKQINWMLVLGLIVGVFFLFSYVVKNSTPSNDKYSQIAEELGLDVEEFNQCFNKKTSLSKINSDVKSGEEIGIRGTPGIILVNTQTNKGVLFEGSVDLNTLNLYKNALLSDEIDNEKLSVANIVENFKYTPLRDEDNYKGNRDAVIQFIEYSDYECPYCRNFHETAESFVEENSSDVVWVFRHFPLDSIHKHAREMAIAAECASKSGGNEAFFLYTEKLFK